MRANKPLFPGDIPLGKKARFYRVFPENGASVTGISSPTFDRWVPRPGNPGRTQNCHGDDLPNL
jgi:hypothetical protein